MPDWCDYVRRNLRLRGFRPEREAEIVEEVARQLEDAYAEALRLGASLEQAREAVQSHIADWNALARELEESHRGRESSMTTLQNAAEDRDFRNGGALSAFTEVRQDILIRIARPEKESRLHGRGGADAGAVHRRQYLDFQHHERRHAEVAARARSATLARVAVERAPRAQGSRCHSFWRLPSPVWRREPTRLFTLQALPGRRAKVGAIFGNGGIQRQFDDG